MIRHHVPLGASRTAACLAFMLGLQISFLFSAVQGAPESRKQNCSHVLATGRSSMSGSALPYNVYMHLLQSINDNQFSVNTTTA